jgi:hypothetical protein
LKKIACIVISIGRAGDIISDCDDPGIARRGSELLTNFEYGKAGGFTPIQPLPRLFFDKSCHLLHFFGYANVPSSHQNSFYRSARETA